mmetsp:Transcript_17879/g.27080  ORF Transcript_17879/g.27080 Transcript_17879/m.27080 type:complete len:113 (-) Transcript_17879:88-426(-)
MTFTFHSLQLTTRFYVLTQCFIIQAAASLYMLRATLLFEKKISQQQCTLLAVPVFYPVIETVEGAISDYLNNNPETLSYSHYSNEVFGQCYVYHSCIVLCRCYCAWIGDKEQ